MVHKLEELVTELVDQRVREKHEELVYALANYKEAFITFVGQIMSEHDYATTLVADYANEELKLNTIEAEGYLRCTTTLRNYLKTIEENFDVQF